MSEHLAEIDTDDALIEGLSNEPFVVETAGAMVDAMLGGGRQPDLNNYYHYLEAVYGISDDRAYRALIRAQGRIPSKTDPRDL
ncbi:hypothetical protein A2884_01705 [Candidatus Saccharibacteria bacterium RIFCSPHIGHO2_01_FULL_48_12]|nr:MAG: hypothetical protein A2884_01705 [Candidatus Saccharibacteria bacterium RIFCSPHIGHO2_01_FULL_48_12]